jgi:hypothetical protein
VPRENVLPQVLRQLTWLRPPALTVELHSRSMFDMRLLKSADSLGELENIRFVAHEIQPGQKGLGRTCGAPLFFSHDGPEIDDLTS